MKQIRKFALAIGASLLITSLAACGSNTSGNTDSSKTTGSTVTEGSAAPSITRDENGYPDLNGTTFKIWQRNFRTDVAENYGDFENIKELQRLFNMKVEFQHPPVGQDSENFTMMMASSTLPDLIFSSGIDEYYAGGLGMAYNDGILYDYTEYVNETNTPLFMDILNKNKYLEKIVSDDEGRIVRLGAKLQGSEDADFQFDGLFLRKDFLEATGLEVPTTIDEWTEVLAAMKANGVEHPLGVSQNYNLGLFAYAWNINSRTFTVDDDKQLVFGPYTENFKEYLTVMNEWFEAGYINPDYMNTGDNDTISMISNDRVGATHMHVWNYQNIYYPTTEADNADKGFVGAQNPVLNEGDPLPDIRYTSKNVDDYKYITVDAKDPLAAVHLLDTLYAPEISALMDFGVEGFAWEKVDGQIKPIVIPVDAPVADQLKTHVTQWHTYEDNDADIILSEKYNAGGLPDALQLWAESDSDGYFNSRYIYFSDEEASVRARYGSDIATYVSEWTSRFITGTADLADFDDYLAELKSIGVEDYIAATQTAYDRYTNR